MKKSDKEKINSIVESLFKKMQEEDVWIDITKKRGKSFCHSTLHATIVEIMIKTIINIHINELVLFNVDLTDLEFNVHQLKELLLQYSSVFTAISSEIEDPSCPLRVALEALTKQAMTDQYHLAKEDPTHIH